MYFCRSEGAAHSTSTIYVGLSLLTSFDPHYLVSFAFVLRVTKAFACIPRSVMASHRVRQVRIAENASVDAVQPRITQQRQRPQ